MTIPVARVRDVSEGLQPGQFAVGEHDEVESLEDLDPVYRRLMDEPVTSVLAVTGGDGRPNLTPMWFLYEGDKVLINTAEHRRKAEWIRADPRLSLLLMNPENPYHWMSFKLTVEREILEEDPEEGHRATETIDEMWTKYTGNEPPYGLRDPAIEERRILFECRVDRIATFGKP